jgi:hypothetical protein
MFWIKKLLQIGPVEVKVKKLAVSVKKIMKQLLF